MTPTATGTRIRWEHADPVTPGTPAAEGYIGTISEPQFFIFNPDDRDAQAILTSPLPGLPPAGHAERRAYSDDRDWLKGLAEQWLEEFAASLGAVFPETRDGERRCPRDHKRWGRGLAMDRIPGGGWSCPGILADGRACGLELAANGQERRVNDEPWFPEPFGPEYVRPPGQPCPGCGCCTLRLCQTAEARHGPCSHFSDDPQRVSGCPCSTLAAQTRTEQEQQR